MNNNIKKGLAGRLHTCGKLAAATCIVMIIVAAVLWAVYPFPRERVAEAQAGGSALILDRRGGLIAWRVDGSETWRLPVSVEDVSPWLVKATLAAEDKRFHSHHGVDPLALARAAWLNVSHARRLSGASTITMQAIRLLWPKRRTYPAKAVEAFRSLQVESFSTKDDILQLYFNIAPYGGNVVGAGAAARRYFGKSCAELSLGEAALLAGIPQRPARFNPRKHLDNAVKRREFVFERMLALGVASEEQVRAAQRERITIRRSPCITDAPRFADFVLNECKVEGGVVRTTLDPLVQAAARSVVMKSGKGLRAMGIDGTAAVVLDVRKSQLLAMVGTADPSDPQIGCVNGATARRQPGSLLKPFIYAAAFDSGDLTPQTVVYDVPSSWHGYSPENMDRRFLGPMPAARALAQSRNIPAVRLLGRLGSARLARDIRSLGVDVAAAEDRCGLSLALGTAEVRLIDVANAYAALARLGEYRPLRVLAGDGGGPERRVYSPGAAFLTLRCLSNGVPGAAWKTGTSWKNRDAWAIVVTPKFVVAAWCGRLSGRGHPALVGARTALPLAVEIAGRLPGAGELTWRRPDTVAARKVCAASGAPATDACRQTTEADYLPGISSDAPCRIHRRVRHGEVGRVAAVWPPEVASFLQSRAKPVQGKDNSPQRSIEIASPADGAEYVLPSSDLVADGVLGFSARTTAAIDHVYWFLDGEFAGRTRRSGSIRWPMETGEHELVASDGAGLVRRVRFVVLAGR